MSELRWWLLILGAAFFAGLTLWELRRPRQARDRETPPEATRAPREPPLQLPEMHARESLTGRELPVVELPDDPGSLPILEPLADEAGEPAENRATEAGVEAPPPAEAPPPEDLIEVEYPASSAELPELPATPAPRVEWPPDAERRVMALRLVAPLPDRFAGRSLRQALAAEGFVLGRFDIFHKGDESQRAVLSAASLTRPGTFDPQTMDSQHFGGLSLFAVLPGPMSPPQAFEELVATARSLNDRLCGVLQDENGTPLTPARIATLRERFAAGALS